jgi:hypothetical protein
VSVDVLLARLDGVHQTGPDRWRARCPVCGGTNDTKLSVGIGDSGGVVAYCFGCESKGPDVCAALGIDPGELFPDHRADDRHRPPPMRRPFPLTDFVRALDDDLLFVYFVIRDVLEAKPIASDTGERLTVIARRIHAGRLACLPEFARSHV